MYNDIQFVHAIMKYCDGMKGITVYTHDYCMIMHLWVFNLANGLHIAAN